MFVRAERIIKRVEKVIIIASFMVMFISTVAQVLIRFLDIPFYGTADISLLNMSFLTFIGAGLAVYTKDHISIDISELIKSKLLVFYFKLFSNIFIGIFGLLLITIVYPFFTFILHSGEKTLELGIPIAIPIGSMILGGGLIVLHSVGAVIRLARDRK